MGALNRDGELDEADARADWRSHPHTQLLKQGMLNGIEAAHGALIAACHNSTDPVVKHAYGALVALKNMHEVYFPTPRKL